MARWPALLVGAMAALAVAACKETNPLYCADAPYHHCVDGGSLIDILKADAADDAADAGTDAPAVDAAMDVNTGCRSDDDCRGAPGGPACEPTTRACVACTADKHCRGDGGTAVCDTGARACVACVVSADCVDPGKPICRANVCGACKTDGECVDRNGPDPGICMAHQDGRCASDAETIYVQNTTGCSMDASTGGAKGQPFCRSQMALDRVAAAQRVVLLRGADMSPWVATVAGAPVTIVGQMGASIVPGVDIGISIASGDVYVRDVIVDGGRDVGISVATGAIIRLDRVIVRSNAKGGLVALGTGFEVVNSVFDRNGSGSVGPSGFGGAYLGATTLPGAPHLFHYNTVISNLAQGVVCASSTQTISSLLLYGNGSGDSVYCTVTSSKRTTDGDPAFDTSRLYHLTASSPCVGAGDASDVPPDDLDGQARPNGAVDCGADEYYAP